MQAEQILSDVVGEKDITSVEVTQSLQKQEVERKVSGIEQDFNKQMRYVFDKEELRFRQKQQMFGNMKLLCELYLRALIPADIITLCLTSLFDEINDMNVEIVCHIISKLGNYVAKMTKRQLEGEQLPKKIITSKIDVTYIKEQIRLLFSHRNNALISSRIRFKIQDVMELFPAWEEIFEQYEHSQKGFAKKDCKT